MVNINRFNINRLYNTINLTDQLIKVKYNAITFQVLLISKQ